MKRRFLLGIFLTAVLLVGDMATYWYRTTMWYDGKSDLVLDTSAGSIDLYTNRYGESTGWSVRVLHASPMDSGCLSDLASLSQIHFLGFAIGWPWAPGGSWELIIP